MTSTAIASERAVDLARQDHFAPLSDVSVSLKTPEIRSAEAWTAAEVLAEKKEVDLSKYGFYPIPDRGVVVTNELVNQLRDELGI